MSGLLISGRQVDVPGVTVINGTDAAWCVLDPRDYRPRKTHWVHAIVMHTTKGIWPQHVKPGTGPAGRERNVAAFWKSDPTRSAAHIVIGSDGTVACLADLAQITAYHATVSNEWSIGIELYQEADGGIYEAVYDSAVRVVPVICDTIGIPLQVPSEPYNGHPIARLLDGGPGVAGVYGHRSNTEQRGRGDPGDEIFSRLVADAGAEALDFSTGEDLRVGAARQTYLVQHGSQIPIDSKVGPGSLWAAKRQGFKRWRDVPLS